MPLKELSKKEWVVTMRSKKSKALYRADLQMINPMKIFIRKKNGPSTAASTLRHCMKRACLLFSLLITFTSCDQKEEEEDLTDLKTMVQADHETSSAPGGPPNEGEEKKASTTK